MPASFVQPYAAAGVPLDDALCGYAHRAFGNATYWPRAASLLASACFSAVGELPYSICLRNLYRWIVHRSSPVAAGGCALDHGWRVGWRVGAALNPACKAPRAHLCRLPVGHVYWALFLPSVFCGVRLRQLDFPLYLYSRVPGA